MQGYTPMRFHRVVTSSGFFMDDNVFQNPAVRVPYAMMEGMRAYQSMIVDSTIKLEETEDRQEMVEIQLEIQAARDRFVFLAEGLALFHPAVVLASLVTYGGDPVSVTPQELRARLDA